MLLPRRRCDLNLRRTLLFALLLALVGLAHWQLAQHWQAWAEMQMKPAPAPPRLAVQLGRTMALHAPPPASPTPAPRPAPSPRVLHGPGGAALPSPAASAIEPNLMPPATAELRPLLAAVPDLAGDDEPGPEWPLSTRLRYSLTGHYQGPVHGDAEVEWLRQGRRYQVRLTVSIGPRMAPFMSRRMLSEGELTPQGIRPQRYDEDTRVFWATPRRITLNLSPGRIDYPNDRSEAAPLGVQDSASQFVQLTWLLLTGREVARPGLAIHLPLALPRRLYAWRYEVVGSESIDTPIGALEAWQLRPVVADTRGTLRATVWLAPRLQYLPVRIRIQQDEGVWVDLVLAELPLQEAAPAADNPRPN